MIWIIYRVFLRTRPESPHQQVFPLDEEEKNCIFLVRLNGKNSMKGVRFDIRSLVNAEVDVLGNVEFHS